MPRLKASLRTPFLTTFIALCTVLGGWSLPAWAQKKHAAEAHPKHRSSKSRPERALTEHQVTAEQQQAQLKTQLQTAQQQLQTLLTQQQQWQQDIIRTQQAWQELAKQDLNRASAPNERQKLAAQLLKPTPTTGLNAEASVRTQQLRADAARVLRQRAAQQQRALADAAQRQQTMAEQQSQLSFYHQSLLQTDARLREQKEHIQQLEQQLKQAELRAYARKPSPAPSVANPVPPTSDKPAPTPPPAPTANRPSTDTRHWQPPLLGRPDQRFRQNRQRGLPISGWTWKRAAGQPVHAAQQGQVVFAEPLRGYGFMMILDHGQGITTVYAWLSNPSKKLGDNVQAGETLAHTGQPDNSEQSGLYFELRRQGVPVNPGTWLGTKSR